MASPARSPVSISTMTRWRVVGSSMARLFSFSSWAITNSATKRGTARGPFGEVVLVDLGVGGDVVEPVVASVVIEEGAQADQGQASGVG